MIAHDPSPSPRKGTSPCTRSAVAALILLKLLLTSTDEIASFNADDTGYAAEAQAWYWGNDYGLYAFTRPPTYPLFIALAGALGLPQRVAIELTWIGACLIAARALRACGVSRPLALVAFALLLFDPLSLTLLSRLLPDGLYAACVLVLITAGGAVLCAATLKAAVRWSILASVAGALAATSRPESVLIVLVVALSWLIAAAVRRFARVQADAAPNTVPERVRFGLAVLFPLACIFTLTSMYSAINHARIGIYAPSDFLMPGFRSLYRVLLSIEPNRPSLLLPVPRDVRERAYALSPSFATLRPYLDGATPVPDGREECRHQTGAEREYGAWTCWALRAAAWRARESEPGGGWYRSAAELDTFFARSAAELRAGIVREHVPARWTPTDFVPPEWRELAEEMPGALWRNCVRLVHRDYARAPPETVPLSAEAAFNIAALRRTALVRLARAEPVAVAWHQPRVIERLDRSKRAIAKVQNLLAPVAALAGAAGCVLGLTRLRRLDARARGLLTLLLVCVVACVLRLVFVAALDATGLVFVRVIDASGHAAAAPAIGGPPVQLRYLFPVSVLLPLLLVLGIELCTAAWRRQAVLSACANTDEPRP